MIRNNGLVRPRVNGQGALGKLARALAVGWSLALMLFLGQIDLAQAQVATQVPAAAQAHAAAQAQGDKSFLWSVSDGTGIRLYLLGSVHVAQKSMYPLKPVIEDTFKKADALLVEVDIRTLDIKTLALDLFESGLYPRNETIWDHLDPEMTSMLKDRINQLGLKEYLFVRMRPWLVALTLGMSELQGLGYEEQLGLDLHFMNQAHDQGLDVLSLETANEQLKALNSFNETESVLFLKNTLLEFDNIGKDIEDIYKCWREGDAVGFEELFFKSFNENPELAPVYEVLIVERNKKLFERLAPHLKKYKSPFVVIGASHLTGDTGLLAAFKAAGYEVTQL